MARTTQISNDFRQKLLADALSLEFRQHCQHNYLSSASIAEAVANELVAEGAHVAR